MSGSRHLSRGDSIGPYRVEGPLGKGGMGEVVVAYDERLDRRVAIKRIRHDAPESRDAATDRERLRREARAAAKLSHPAIVQIHDILTFEDGEAIVMELIEGRSMAEWLEQGPLPLHEALRLARQIAEGLAEAHLAGLVHRDLKAENVMVTTPDGSHPSRAKILDFGLVKALDRPSATATLDANVAEPTLTKEGAVLGTLRAMSPEQAQGTRIDHRSDLFSFGVLLYEMLTGRSPFRGANALGTLRQLLVEIPRPVRELRPGVPVELERLVERLLEKQPEHRPGDSAAVARTLGEMAARFADPSGSGPTEADRRGSDSLGDLPTGAFEPTARPQREPEHGPTPSSQSVRVETPGVETPGVATPGVVRSGDRRIGPVALIGLLVLVVAGFVLLRSTAERPEPLRVVVPRALLDIPEPSENMVLVASGVLVASLATLADLEGVAPVEPEQLSSDPLSLVDIARSVAADEILSTTVEPRGNDASVTLRRVRGTDGEVLWVSSFDVPDDPAAARLLAEAVAVQLRRAYPERALRPEVSRQDYSDADYTAFVTIFQRLGSGEVPWEPELDRLEEISRRAPGFMAAHLKGAAIARTLYTDTRDTTFLERGETLLERARELAPDDPGMLLWTFRIALDRGRRQAAEAVLERMVELAPYDIDIQLCRSYLAEHDGDLDGAVTAMAEVVERRPSWQSLHRLSELELRRGDVDDARRHLEQLIALVPTNPWGLAKLARLELFYGDLERAASLYQGVIELKPHRSYFTNLGLARYMLGRYAEARESYLQALEMAPDHLFVRLNLADTEMALAERDVALGRYRQILAELEQRPLDATERMTMAQCLAHLGEGQRAVSVTLDTLQRHPQDLEVVYMAALVYALVGDAASALVNTEKALAKGYPARWFKIPGFDVLEHDPRFRALLDAAPSE